MIAQPLADDTAFVTADNCIAIPVFSAPLATVVGLARTAGLALPRGRPAISALGNLRLAVEDGHLSVAATDLEVYIEARQPLLAGTVEGAVLVPTQVVAYLERLAAVGRGEQLAVCASDQRRLQLRLGRRGSEFAVAPTDDFPAFPAGDDPGVLTLKASELAGALAFARAAVAPGTENPTFAAVSIVATGDRLTFAGTDGFAASRCGIGLGNAGVSLRVLVPHRAVDVALRILGQTAEAQVRLAISANGGTLILATGGVRIATRLLSGAFPDLAPLRARVPDVPGVAATCAVADLIEAVRICAVTRDDQDGLALSYREETLRLSARNDLGAVLEPVPCVAVTREAGPPSRIRLDGAKLLNILSGLAGRCPDGLVTLAWEHPTNAPALIVPGEGTGGEDFALLMGMSG